MTERRPIYPAHETQVQQLPTAEERPWVTAPWIPLDGLAAEWASFAKDHPTELVFRAISHAFTALAYERDAYDSYTQAKRVLAAEVQVHITWGDHFYLLSRTSYMLCEAAQLWTRVVENLSESIPDQYWPLMRLALRERLRVTTIAHAVQQELLFRCEHAFERQQSRTHKEVAS